MATIAELAVNVVARTQGFVAGMKTAEKSVSNFSRGAQSGLASIKSFGSQLLAIGGLSISAVAALRGISGALSEIDRVAKQAARIGDTPRNLLALQTAAELSGVSVEQFSRAMDILQKNLGEAATGTGEAQKALARLGLSVEELIARSPTEQIEAISDALNRLPSAAEKAAVAADLFGRSGVQLLNFLAGGSEGIRQVRDELDRLGVGFSEEQAARVELFNDRLLILRTALGAIAQDLVINLTPAVTVFVDTVTNTIAAVRSLFDVFSTTEAQIFASVAAFAAGALAAGKLITIFGLLSKQIVKLTKAFVTLQALSGPSGLIALGVGVTASIAAFELLSSHFDDAESSVQQLNAEVGKLDSEMTDVNTSISKVAQSTKTAGDGFDKLTESITKQIAALKASSTELDTLRATFDQSAKDTKFQAGQVEFLEKALNQTRKEIQALETEFEEANKVRFIEQGKLQDLNDLREEATRLETELKGARGELEKNQKALSTTSDAAKELNKDLDEAAQVTERFRDPVEKLQSELTRLQDLFFRGLIDPGTFERGSEQLREEIRKLQDVGKEAEKATKKAVDFSREISRINDLLAEGFTTDKARTNFDALVSSLGALSEDEARQALQAFTDQLEEGKRLTEQFLTPLERFNNQLANLNSLLDAGAIKQEVFAAAVLNARKALVSELEASIEAEASLLKLADDTELLLQTEKARAEFQALTQGLDQVTQKVNETRAQIRAQEAIIDPLGLKETREGLEKFQSQLEKAKQITEEFQTPLQKFESRMRELAELQRLLPEDVFARAAAAAREEFEKATKAVDRFGKAQLNLQGVSAALLGTREAFSAIAEAERIQRAIAEQNALPTPGAPGETRFIPASTPDQPLLNLEEQTQIQRQQLDELRSIREAVEGTERQSEESRILELNTLP